MMLGGVGSAAGYAYGLLMGKHEMYQDADPTMRATHLIIPGKAFGLDHDIILAPKPFELAVGIQSWRGCRDCDGDWRPACCAQRHDRRARCSWLRLPCCRLA